MLLVSGTREVCTPGHRVIIPATERLMISMGCYPASVQEMLGFSAPIFVFVRNESCHWLASIMSPRTRLARFMHLIGAVLSRGFSPSALLGDKGKLAFRYLWVIVTTLASIRIFPSPNK